MARRELCTQSSTRIVCCRRTGRRRRTLQHPPMIRVWGLGSSRCGTLGRRQAGFTAQCTRHINLRTCAPKLGRFKLEQEEEVDYDGSVMNRVNDASERMKSALFQTSATALSC